MGKFIIRNTKTGYTFSLKAGNGEIIATSEVYSSLSACKSGVASVQKTAPNAPVEDQTLVDSASAKCPKFEIFEDKSRKCRFRLKAGNGEIIGSSEAYNSKDSCKNGIDSVKRNATTAEMVVEE